MAIPHITSETQMISRMLQWCRGSKLLYWNKGRIWAQIDLFLRKLTNLVPVVGRSRQVPLHKLHHCHHDVMAGFPQQEQSMREHGQTDHIFYDPASEVTHHYFCNILMAIKSASFHVRGNYTRLWIAGSEDRSLLSITALCDNNLSQSLLEIYFNFWG